MIQRLLRYLIVLTITITGWQSCFCYNFDRESLKKSYNCAFDNLSFSDEEDDEFANDQGKLFNSQVSENKKNAMIIAVFPGAIVHGLGHLYLGKTDGFIALFGGELISIWLMTFPDYDQRTFDESKKKIDYQMLRYLGATLFVSTWIYDIFECNRIASEKCHSNINTISLQPVFYKREVIPAIVLLQPEMDFSLI